jgi:hypothetical protein
MTKIVTEDLALIVSIAVIIVASVLAWLLLRGPRLWYWKVNQKADTLMKIENRLKQVEKHLVYEEGQISDKRRSDSLHFPPEKLEGEESDSLSAMDMSTRLSPDKGQVTEALNDKPIETSLGKSGRLYRADELEAQIKD